MVVALAGTVEGAKRLLEVRDRRAIDRAMANARQADSPFGTIPPRGITRDRLKCGVTYRQLEKEVRLSWYANTERSSCAEMMCDVEVDGVWTKVSQGIFWMVRSFGAAFCDPHIHSCPYPPTFHATLPRIHTRR